MRLIIKTAMKFFSLENVYGDGKVFDDIGCGSYDKEIDSQKLYGDGDVFHDICCDLMMRNLILKILMDLRQKTEKTLGNT